MAAPADAVTSRTVATWGRQVISISLLGFAVVQQQRHPEGCASFLHAVDGRRARAPSTTTTTVPLYSFDNSVPPPEILNTGTNYKKILQSLLDYANWTGAHRVEPSLAVNFTAPSSTIDAGYRHDLGLLRDDRKRAYEVRNGQDEIRIVSRTPTVFTAR